MKRIAFSIVILLYLSSATAQEMLKVADSVRKYRNIPGLVYAVFTTEAILDSGCVGVKKMRVKGPIRWQNRFQIGATTATFTAYLAAQMVKEGKISWNTSIIKMFPELEGKSMKIYHKITLQQLLSQNAGLPPYEEYAEWRDIHSLHGTPPQQRAIFVGMMLKRKPAIVIDSSKSVYSVAGTAIAAAMLERASKKSWEQLIDQYINKPLTIKIDFDFPALKDSTQPWGHWDNYFTLTPHIDDYYARFFTPIAPAGNINISMDDYIVFIRDHLLALQNKNSKIGKQDAEHLLFKRADYSTGWYNIKWRGMNIAYCPGRGGLFSSYVEIIKEKNIGIIVLCNNGAVDGRSGVSNLGKILRNYYAK